MKYLVLLVSCLSALYGSQDETYHPFPFSQIIIRHSLTEKNDGAKASILEKIKSYDQSRVLVQGYIVERDSIQYLVSSPSVKTCCAKMFAKEHERIFLETEEHFDPLVLHTVKGYFTVDPSRNHTLILSSIDSIQASKTQKIKSISKALGMLAITSAIVFIFFKGIQIRSGKKNR